MSEIKFQKIKFFLKNLIQPEINILLHLKGGSYFQQVKN